MTVLVYAGPTITADAVRRVLPQAGIRPPAARGDLLGEDWKPGDVAVLIDGFFRERRSVGHKEILRLLAAGVDVVGAASMGALRAAELSPCGMRGVGEVYAMYRSGEIDGDDEVGLLHGPAERGYPARTVALVNLRHGVREGARSGRVPAAAGARIIAAAKALPFMDRSWEVLAAAVPAGDRDALNTLEQGIASGEWDLKHRDAVAALHAARDRRAAPSRPAVTFPGISEHQALDRRSRHEYAPGRWRSDLDVLDAARLFDAGYPARHERVLGALLDGIATAAGTDTAGYAYAKLGVGETLPRPLAKWLTDAETTGLTPAERIRLVMIRVWPVWQSVDWRPAVLADLRAAPGWPDWEWLVTAADEATEQTRHRLAAPPPAIRAQIFQRHWRGPGTTPDIEMARRGFCSAAELGATVGRYFALDMRTRGTR
ncbi:TfuA-like protein [Actinoplanes sp. NPDC051494]|uniref:TfuA-like protein n=1 Tax=Actinoplanes sp. NPDC051494 TaxID=3363907 RepID=UPI00379C8AC8